MEVVVAAAGPGRLGRVLARCPELFGASATGALCVLASAVTVGLSLAVIGLSPTRVAALFAVCAIGVGMRLHGRFVTIRREGVEPMAVLAVGVAILGVTRLGMGRWETFVAVLAYLPLARGLLSMFAARLPGREIDALVEGGLGALGVGVGLWLLASQANAPHSLLFSIMLPGLDAGLLIIAARLALLPAERIAVHRYVVLGFAYLFGAHLALVLTVLTGVHRLVSMPEVLGVVALGFLAVAGLDASTRMVDEPLAVDPPRFSPGHVALVVGAMLLGPTTVGVASLRHSNVSSTTALGATMVAVVLAAYMGNLLWDRATTEHRVTHDELTGLPNRALLFDRLSRALAHSARSSAPVAVMFIDLDRFKSVNDTFGHRAGDELLQQVAHRLQACLRQEDTVARLAGDEFAILLPHVSGPEGVVTVAERVKDAFLEPVMIAHERCPVTASIGVAQYPFDGDTPEELLSSADAAMYRAKEAGRNTYEIYSAELANRAHERLAMEAALVAAIEKDEFVLHYQPCVDLATGQVVGAEALVRWNHPERGLVGPAEFIPIAEQSDLVVQIGNWVLDAAFAQAAAWASTDGLPALTIAVNVSARQLRDQMAQRIASALRRNQLDPRAIILELTESAAVDDIDGVASILREVRDMGVGWAVDDFGTGYCSLTYLSRLPVDTLKIDKSFVQSEKPADLSIVTAIIAMGHSLGMSVVAEGIETMEQLKRLSGQSCDRAQGFLFSQPLPAAEFEGLVRRTTVDAVS